MAALIDLATNPVAAPLDVASILGMCTWFCHLKRGMLSCFDRVYDFVRMMPERDKVGVSEGALDELLLCMALAPLWLVDPRAPWMGRLTASDASVAFGFGVSKARRSPALARQLGRLSAAREDHARLTLLPEYVPEKSRAGQPLRLPLSQDSCKTALSTRALHPGHSGGFRGECGGACIALAKQECS